jgi:hypothetical protein
VVCGAIASVVCGIIASVVCGAMVLALGDCCGEFDPLLPHAAANTGVAMSSGSRTRRW